MKHLVVSVVTAIRENDGLPLSAAIAISIAETVKDGNYPSNVKHHNFLAHVQAHFGQYAHLFHLGAILPQQSERQFIVEHLAPMFMALERIYGVAQIKWIERQSATAHEGIFTASIRSQAEGSISYATNAPEVTASRGRRNFDVVGVKISGSPHLPQHADHNVGDSVKLDTEAAKALVGRLLRFARKRAKEAATLEVLTLQGISKRLTLLSHRLVGRWAIETSEIFSAELAFSPEQTAAMKRHLELAWIIQRHFRELVARENDLAELEDCTEGDTIRDWLPNLTGQEVDAPVN
ncbi:hypothetical protein HDU85_001520 [Gaertneriomyces sp. JEL0708]|nr:hypothetical protein HDU85_001520 [Gaertneriomyces sp. JEL0708]